MDAWRTKELTRYVPGFWPALLLAAAACTSLPSPERREDSGWLALTISPERSQPGCPILVRLHVASGGPELVRGELRWRVAHGRSMRDGVVPLALAPVAGGTGGGEVKVVFKPPGAGTYQVEVRVEDAKGRMSTVTSRHDVSHVWPFGASIVCDDASPVSHETSAP